MANPTTSEVKSEKAEPARRFMTPREELDAAPRVLIRVHKTGDRNEQKHVYVGINGVGYQIERGKDIAVPEPVMLNLRDSVQTVWEYDESQNTLVSREAQAYPFTLLN